MVEARIYAALDVDGYAVTNDSGATWRAYSAPRNDSVLRIAAGEDGTVYLGTTGGHVYRRTRGSAGWSEMTTTASGGAHGAAAAIAVNAAGQVLVGWGDGTLEYSVDGVSYTTVGTTSGDVGAVAWGADNSGWALNSDATGAVYRSPTPWSAPFAAVSGAPGMTVNQV